MSFAQMEEIVRQQLGTIANELNLLQADYEVSDNTFGMDIKHNSPRHFGVYDEHDEPDLLVSLFWDKTQEQESWTAYFGERYPRLSFKSCTPIIARLLVELKRIKAFYSKLSRPDTKQPNPYPRGDYLAENRWWLEAFSDVPFVFPLEAPGEPVVWLPVYAPMRAVPSLVRCSYDGPTNGLAIQLDGLSGQNNRFFDVLHGVDQRRLLELIGDAVLESHQHVSSWDVPEASEAGLLTWKQALTSWFRAELQEPSNKRVDSMTCMEVILCEKDEQAELLMRYAKDEFARIGMPHHVLFMYEEWLIERFPDPYVFEILRRNGFW